jgi:hypothetical protein
MDGGGVTPLYRDIARDSDQARIGVGQQLDNPSLPEPVIADMQIREMSDDQTIELRRESRKPGVVPRDLQPIRFNEPGVAENQQCEKKKDCGAARNSREPASHERSNRPNCISSARVNGIG